MLYILICFHMINHVIHVMYTLVVRSRHSKPSKPSDICISIISCLSITLEIYCSLKNNSIIEKQNQIIMYIVVIETKTKRGCIQIAAEKNKLSTSQVIPGVSSSSPVPDICTFHPQVCYQWSLHWSLTCGCHQPVPVA